MRKNLYMYLAALVLGAVCLGTGGCIKSHFKIDFEINPDVWGTYQLTYYAQGPDGGGKWISQSIPLEGGKFSLSGVSLRPTLGSVSTNGGTPLWLWIEPGDKIKITGKESNTSTWSVGGNGINKDWEAFRNNYDTDKGAPGERIKEYIQAHPDSKLSALLLLTGYPRREDPEGFADLWNTLDSKADAAGIAAIIGDADIISGYPFTLASGGRLRYDAPKRPVKSLSLRQTDGKDHTFRISGRTPGDKPSLLYFYRRGDGDHYQTVKILKEEVGRLAGKHREATEVQVAAICLDPDSVTWQSAMRSDSLKNVTDAWMPLSLADRQVRMLGITSTPAFVSVDRRGRQLYRGADAAKATAALVETK